MASWIGKLKRCAANLRKHEATSCGACPSYGIIQLVCNPRRRIFGWTLPDLAVLVEPLLVVRRALREQFVILHRHLLAIVRDDEVCRRARMPWCPVGPITCLPLKRPR